MPAHWTGEWCKTQWLTLWKLCLVITAMPVITNIRVSHFFPPKGKHLKPFLTSRIFEEKKINQWWSGGGWSLRLQMLICWMTHNCIRKSEIKNPHLKIGTFSWAPKQVLTKELKLRQRSHWRSSKSTSGWEHNRKWLLCPGKNISLGSSTALRSTVDYGTDHPSKCLRALHPIFQNINIQTS